MKCPDSILNSKVCSFSPTGKENHIFDSKRDTGISIPISELKSHCHVVSTEIRIKEKKKIEDFDAFSQPSPIWTTPRSFKWTSQRALFMDKGHLKCQNMAYVHYKEVHRMMVKILSSETNKYVCLTKFFV